MSAINLVAAAAESTTGWNGNIALQLCFLVWLVLNAAAILLLILGSVLYEAGMKQMAPLKSIAGRFLTYEVLVLGAGLMLLPFYWMVVTAFKDGQTAAAFPPVWTPSRVETLAPAPDGGEMISVVPLQSQMRVGEPIRVVPETEYTFQRVDEEYYSVTREIANPEAIYNVDPTLFEMRTVLDVDLKNFRRAWYRPEESSRGAVNFLTYFIVSLITATISTSGALTTSAFAAFAFARLQFFGKTMLFYLILATMMVPGQVLLIPNFLILSKLQMLDTYAALTVPWIASVFTIFLMRQFFMTIPEDLWDAARIDGASRFRYLWQIVVPLSKPVFITAGIFDFLMNWNSLLWPLIVTSTPTKRTLMVGLQYLNDDAGTEFHILMAASCFAILPIVIGFFFLQRFFIQGIARTGFK